MKMQISLFLPTLVLFLILCVTFGRANKPNILVIVADDMGYSDLGCYGGEIKSPHLDGLAKQGLRFTNFYVNNMCWPTRASLLSGLYPETVLTRKKPGGRGLRRETTLLPEALKSEGYATFMSGKWHLSNSEKPNGPSTPHNRGFDSFYGTIEGASDFFAPAGLQLNGEDLTHEWKGDRDYYYTDASTDYALKFLKEREQPESNPFVL